mmetsp:Transcript_9814/g.16381  ORF Transcript_9814/g.16381 Transcript_9814/m.16381 type:complete len:198 (+) Transcript_9814:181-774(+)
MLQGVFHSTFNNNPFCWRQVAYTTLLSECSTSQEQETASQIIQALAENKIHQQEVCKQKQLVLFLLFFEGCWALGAPLVHTTVVLHMHYIFESMLALLWPIQNSVDKASFSPSSYIVEAECTLTSFAAGFSFGPFKFLLTRHHVFLLFILVQDDGLFSVNDTSLHLLASLPCIIERPVHTKPLNNNALLPQIIGHPL